MRLSRAAQSRSAARVPSGSPARCSSSNINALPPCPPLADATSKKEVTQACACCSRAWRTLRAQEPMSSVLWCKPRRPTKVQFGPTPCAAHPSAEQTPTWLTAILQLKDRLRKLTNLPYRYLPHLRWCRSIMRDHPGRSKGLLLHAVRIIFPWPWVPSSIVYLYRRVSLCAQHLEERASRTTASFGHC